MKKIENNNINKQLFENVDMTTNNKELINISDLMNIILEYVPESVLTINKTEFIHNNDNMVGYEIKTTEQEIIVGICKKSCCDKEWGYDIVKYPNSDNNENDFIGSIILQIKIDEKSEEVNDIKKINDIKNITYENYGISTNYLTLSIYTNVGKIVIIIWNDHNGYYPYSYYYKYNVCNGNNRIVKTDSDELYI